MGKPKDVRQFTGDDNVSALQSEVRTLAEQLGLASKSHGGGQGFDDSDFRPDKAKKRLGHAPSRRQATGKEPAERRNPQNKIESNGSGRLLKHSNGIKPVQSVHADSPGHMAATGKHKEGRGGPGASTDQTGTRIGALLEDDSGRPWYEVADEQPGAASRLPPDLPPDDAGIEAATRRAEALLEAEAAAFQRRLARTRPADAQWLQTVRQSGTLRDRIAAAALVVEASAASNLRALDELLTLAAKRRGARDAAGAALDALPALFMTSLLPDRRLVAFHERPVATARPGRAGDTQLLLWWVEGCIKQRYSALLALLEESAGDTLEWIREKALRGAADLLSAKPEAESRLLSLLVNKLGDPSRRVASKAGYLISRLLTTHPRMGMVVAGTIEAFIFRGGQRARAQYYAVVTLNQMVLGHSAARGGAALAAKLVDIYFTLFHLVLGGGALLGDAATGDDAARPAAAAAAPDRGAGRKKDRRKKDRRRKGAAPAAEKAHGSVEDESARMLAALLTGVRRAYPYAEPGALDGIIGRHASQLFRTVHVAPFHVSTQALMLLFQVMDAQQAISDRFYNALYAALLRPELARSAALPAFLSLVFQAAKADVSPRRAAAFVKRLLQVTATVQAGVACGALLLVSELLRAQPALWPQVLHPEDAAAGDEARDADSDGGGGGGAASAPGTAQGGATSSHTAAPATAPAWPSRDYYDAAKRAPQHARAERACMWELSALATHVHPSVASMARTVLTGASIVYDGDPLQDLSLLAFLDKFVRRKAKAPAARGGSVMQPAKVAGGGAEGAAVASSASGAPAGAGPASEAFVALAEQDVAPEDVFFHRFFTMATVQRRRAATRQRRQAKGRRRRGDGGSDGESDGGASGSDGGASGGEDSEAEEAFLEGMEAMEDDQLGDPDAGMSLEEALLADTGDGGGGSGGGRGGGAAASGSEGSGGDTDSFGEPVESGGGMEGHDRGGVSKDEGNLSGTSSEDTASSAPEGSSEGFCGSGSDEEGWELVPPGASGEEVTEEELDGLRLGDVPSPSTSDGTQGGDEEVGSPSRAPVASGASDSGSSGSKGTTPGGVRRALLARRDTGKRKGKRKRKDSLDVFAAYDDYAGLLDKLDSHDSKGKGGKARTTHKAFEPRRRFTT